MYIYIYIHIYTHDMCVYIYIYTFICLYYTYMDNNNNRPHRPPAWVVHPASTRAQRARARSATPVGTRGAMVRHDVTDLNGVAIRHMHQCVQIYMYDACLALMV